MSLSVTGSELLGEDNVENDYDEDYEDLSKAEEEWLRFEYSESSTVMVQHGNRCKITTSVGATATTSTAAAMTATIKTAEDGEFSREMKAMKTEHMAKLKNGSINRIWSTILNHDIVNEKLELVWMTNNAKKRGDSNRTMKKPFWAHAEEAIQSTFACDKVLHYLAQFYHYYYSLTKEDERRKEEDDDNEKQWYEHEVMCKQRRRMRRKLKKWIKKIKIIRQTLENIEEEEAAEDEETTQLAFCCYICKCPQVKSSDSFHLSSHNSGNGSLWHRSCCHNVSGTFTEDWRSPLKRAQDRKVNIKETVLCNDYDLEKKARQAEQQESEAVNEMEMADPILVLLTDPNYRDYCKTFRDVVQGAVGRRGGRATVIDSFAGIGCALVALKRCQINMKTVIVVEPDDVAQHVYKFNHDKSYNEKAPNDDIKYVYDYKTFEHMDQDLDFLMEKYAPIDIIIGGPPCSEFSKVNAFRVGVVGRSGVYLPNFGKFIHKVRKHPRQKSHPVFFLAENVPLDYHSHDGKVVREAFGVCPALIDAKVFSPCRRNRGYYTNIPINNIDFESAASEISAAEVLTDGWMMPADVATTVASVGVKACTFMAGRGRIDDDRMIKVKPAPENEYEVDKINVNEREIMLGLPENYVKGAVDHLYSELTNKAFKAELIDGATWINDLDEKYHHFAGKDFKFASCSEPPLFFEIQMDVPTSNRSRDFFNSDGYAKHLVGNGFSIPVVEHLLRPLQEIFALNSYEDYGYRFPWPPYNCYDGPRIENSGQHIYTVDTDDEGGGDKDEL